MQKNSRAALAMNRKVQLEIHDEWIPIVHRVSMVQDHKLQRFLKELRSLVNQGNHGLQDDPTLRPLVTNLRLARWDVTFRPPEAECKRQLATKGVVVRCKVFPSKCRVDLLIDIDLSASNRNLIDELRRGIGECLERRLRLDRVEFNQESIRVVAQTILPILDQLSLKWPEVRLSWKEIDEIRPLYLKSRSPSSGVFPGHYQVQSKETSPSKIQGRRESDQFEGANHFTALDASKVWQVEGQSIRYEIEFVEQHLNSIGHSITVTGGWYECDGVEILELKSQSEYGFEVSNWLIFGTVPMLLVSSEKIENVVEALACYCICQARWAYCEGLGSSTITNSGFYNLPNGLIMCYDVWSDRVALLNASKLVSSLVILHSHKLRSKCIIEELYEIGVL